MRVDIPLVIEKGFNSSVLLFEICIKVVSGFPGFLLNANDTFL